MDWLWNGLQGIWAEFFSFESRLSVVFLVATLAMAFGLWLWRGRPTRFLSWAFPREVYRHPSNWVDLKITLVNAFLSGVGIFSALAFTPIVTGYTLALLLGPSAADVNFASVDGSLWQIALATLIIILTLDFCTFIEHWMHHESKVLWPFHAVHHSAEIMTPLTVTRQHPVYLAIRMPILSLVYGVVQALMLWLFVGRVDPWIIGGANAGFVLFNFFGSNFRHSHIWISYGPVLEHIFISPAQHHIHHSREVKHFNKNYGEIFAFWDWMFGTLYIPKGHEKITYGLADAYGNPIPQPHGSFRDAMIQPFVESWQNLRDSWAPKENADPSQKVE